MLRYACGTGVTFGRHEGCSSGARAALGAARGGGVRDGVHGRGQRRSARPRARGGPGARRRGRAALRLQADVPLGPLARRGRGPRPLPHGDAARPRPRPGLPELPHAARPGGLGGGRRLGRLQHRLEPLPRRRPVRRRHDAARAGPRRAEARRHGAVAARGAPHDDPGRQGRQGRIPVLHRRLERSGRPPPLELQLGDAGEHPASGEAGARAAAPRPSIVNLHWGTEYSHAISPAQAALAERLTRSPAITAIVGQHVHVVQPIRRIHGKPVVFGEGNLVSNQTAPAARPSRRTG